MTAPLVFFILLTWLAYFTYKKRRCLMTAWPDQDYSLLRIVSFNVKNSTMAKEADVAPLRTMFPLSDILALQEVSIPKTLMGRVPDPDKIVLLEEGVTRGRNFLSDWYALTFVHSGNNARSPNNFGMAIGVTLNSGFRVFGKKIVEVGGKEKKRIVALHGRMKGRLEALTVANMHGDWNGSYENPLNTDAIVRFFEYMGGFRKNHPGSHVVFVGDLNLNRKQVATLLPSLSSKYGTRVYSPTAEADLYSMERKEGVDVDHVITDLRVERLSIPTIKIMWSDHFPVELVVRLPYRVEPSHI